MLDNLPVGWADSLADDHILPSQFYDKRKPPFEPELQLLVAILTDAIYCLLSAKKREQMEAWWWIFDDTTRRHKPNDKFTFHAICEALDLDPSRLRAGLRRKTSKDAYSFSARMMQRRIRGPVVGNMKSVSKLKSLDSIG